MGEEGGAGVGGRRQHLPKSARCARRPEPTHTNQAAWHWLSAASLPQLLLLLLTLVPYPAASEERGGVQVAWRSELCSWWECTCSCPYCGQTCLPNDHCPCYNIWGEREPCPPGCTPLDQCFHPDRGKQDGMVCSGTSVVNYDQNWFRGDDPNQKVCASGGCDPDFFYTCTCKCPGGHEWCYGSPPDRFYWWDFARATGKCCSPDQFCCDGECKTPCGDFWCGCDPGHKCCGKTCCGKDAACCGKGGSFCCKPKEICCGKYCCPAGEACCVGADGSGRCCSAGEKCCRLGQGTYCCAAGTKCCANQWAGSCCSSTEHCCGNDCCASTEQCCGSGCCPKGRTCCNKVCCEKGKVCRSGRCSKPLPPPLLPSLPPGCSKAADPECCDKATDQDCDDVANAQDNCPSINNPKQRGKSGRLAQPDADNDGIGDACGCSSKPMTNPVVVLDGFWRGRIVGNENGVELLGLQMGGRPIAKSVQLPYVVVSTDRGVDKTPVWLRATPSGRKGVPTGKKGAPQSRLVALTKTGAGDSVVVTADFDIDSLGKNSNSCLRVRVKFVLARAPAGVALPMGEPGNPVRGCNPVQGWPADRGGFECGAVRASVEYWMNASRNGETISAFSAAQRLHFAPDGLDITKAGLFRDCETFPNAPSCNAGNHLRRSGVVTVNVFSRIEYPAVTSFGEAFGDTAFDNIHMTAGPKEITAPQDPGKKGTGCPECIHLHWRWGKVTNSIKWLKLSPFDPDFSTGNPLRGDADSMQWAFAAGTTRDAFKQLASTTSRQTLWFLATRARKCAGTGNPPRPCVLLTHRFFANPKGQGTSPPPPRPRPPPPRPRPPPPTRPRPAPAKRN